MFGYLTTSPPVLPRLGTLDAVQIVNRFYCNLTHVTTFTYNHLLRCVTLTQFTILHANIPFLTSSHTLDIFTYSHFSCLSLIDNLLVELDLENWLLRHCSSSYKTLDRTSVTVAWKGYLPIRIATTNQVRCVLCHSRKREGHMIFPYSWCRMTSSWHVV
jgi:hypothetical protein